MSGPIIRVGPVDPATGEVTLHVVKPWSWEWVRFKLNSALVSVFDFFRDLSVFWFCLKAGARHGAETGCTGPLEVRFDPVRGGHLYCVGCLRPILSDKDLPP